MPGFGSYAAVADHFRVTRPVVCYYVALLRRLPADFIQWLDSCTDRHALAFFRERRLRPITRIADPDAQQRHLKELIAEYKDKVVTPS